MKILWLTNVSIPIVNKIVNKRPDSNTIFGGWLDGALSNLINKDNIEIKVVYPDEKEDSGNCNNLCYESFCKNDVKNYNNFFKRILADFDPDIIHIWGTEYKHTKTMVEICKRLSLIDKVVVSIQGLIYKYAEKYYIGIPKKFRNRKTIRDFIKNDSINKQYKSFLTRGENEKIVLRTVNNIIGRTDWDKNSCLEINPNLKYYFCNESLRDVFYEDDLWSSKKCIPHRIFVSQANYPIKGFHFAIMACAELKKTYPDIKLCITQDDFINISWLKSQKKTYYFTYLRHLIRKYKIKDNIEFLGRLTAQQMSEEYRKANLFLSCSTIENSSNAIGEAMLLGTPVVASYTGGTPTMVGHNKTGLLYEVDNTQQLVENITRVFEDNALVAQITKNARDVANNRHNKKRNTEQLIDIYIDICKR